MRDISQLIKSIAILLAVAGVLTIAYISLPRIDRHLDVQSVQICSQMSQHTQVVEEGTTVTYPVQDIFAECVQTLNVN